MKADLTAEQIRKIIHYNPETGVVTRLDGKKITLTYSRYVTKINGSVYKIHRLIWLYMTGKWPETFIDHINLDPSDNRFINLRLATNQQNHWNGRVRNSFGHKGIDQQGPSLFRARIYYNGVRYNLGNFTTKEEAAYAYERAAKKFFGEYANF